LIKVTKPTSFNMALPMAFSKPGLLEISNSHLKISYLFCFLGLGACPSLTIIEISRGSRPSRFASKVKGGLGVCNSKEGMQLLFTPMLLDLGAPQ
jgi:hypothetical protein